jgi:hypothetical protein
MYGGLAGYTPVEEMNAYEKIVIHVKKNPNLMSIFLLMVFPLN